MSKISINGYEPAHLSYSTVNGYRSCGKRFELSKVMRVEEKPGLAALGGNAVHVATEKFDLAVASGELSLDVSDDVDNDSVEGSDSSQNDNQ